MLVSSQKKARPFFTTAPRIKQRKSVDRKRRPAIHALRQVASLAPTTIINWLRQAGITRMPGIIINCLRRVNLARVRGTIINLLRQVSIGRICRMRRTIAGRLPRAKSAMVFKVVVDWLRRARSGRTCQAIISFLRWIHIDRVYRSITGIPRLTHLDLVCEAAIHRIRRVNIHQIRGTIAEQVRHANVGRMQIHMPIWKITAPVLAVIFLTPFILAAIGVSPVASESRLAGIPALSGTETAMASIPDKPAPPKKFAVVIGIVYPGDDLGVVKYADRDAASVYNLLIEKWGFPSQNVVLLRNQEATRTNIDNALRWLTTNPDIDSQSDVVFFYSGHGMRNAPGGGFHIPNLPGYGLVPYDYKNFDARNTGNGLFFDSDLASVFSQINPGRMWIAIDSCFSEGYARPGITGPNRVVTLSSRVDQLSGEIDQTGSGVFTQLVINDGVIKVGAPIEQSFYAALPPAANNFGQNPVISDGYAGDMDFSKAR